MKKICDFFFITGAITATLTVIFYIVQLPFKDKTIVIANMLEALAKNNLQSIGGTANIIGKWVNIRSLDSIPISDTLQYFWDYKIGIVGLMILIIYGTYKYAENRIW